MPSRITYDISPRGVATSFTESELPPEFAARFRNRHINRAGGAEKRQGMRPLGNNVPGSPTLTNAHELVDKLGVETLFVTGEGKIYKYDGVSDYVLVHTLTSTAKIRDVQFGDKLIFYNGVDRNIYTEDGTTFKELIALIISGKANSASNANRLEDSDITDWTTATDTTINDLVYYPGLDAYGLVTNVSASALVTTAVSASAKGLGISSAAVSAGEPYQVIDLIEMNIISDGTSDDNVAIAGAGTSAQVIGVSGVDFSSTEIMIGDFVRNTTRSAVMSVTSVSANINVTKVSAQIAGDSLVFLKSKMPITSFMHAHYGRLYHVDSRDRRRIRISAPDAAEDMTSDGGTLDSITFQAGKLQAKGDIILALASFQSYFVMAGEEQVYIYSGTTPVGTTVDFSPVALLPQGCVSADGVLNIGNAVLFVSHDGVQTVLQTDSESQLQREGLTSQINETLREELDATNSSEVILFHYRQRSWVVLKVGSAWKVINYAAKAGGEAQILSGGASITDFDGKLCRQRAYFERRDDDLICVGEGGKVFLFDKGDYNDDGETYSTEFQTGWLTLGGGRQGGGEKPDARIKQLKYIKPLIEAGDAIVYTIRAEGGFNAESTDTLTITASGGSNAIGLATIPFTIGGSSVINQKHPLRGNGEVIRITYTTQDDKGPDTLSRYTLYANIMGPR